MRCKRDIEHAINNIMSEKTYKGEDKTLEIEVLKVGVLCDIRDILQRIVGPEKVQAAMPLKLPY